MDLKDLCMHIIDRFSGHVRDILARSIQLSSDLKHSAVEPIHLFFVMTNQPGSVATEILTRYKIDPKIIETGIISLPIIPLASAAPNTANVQQLTLTPLSSAVKVILERAMVLAHEFKHS